LTDFLLIILFSGVSEPNWRRCNSMKQFIRIIEPHVLNIYLVRKINSSIPFLPSHLMLRDMHRIVWAAVNSQCIISRFIVTLILVHLPLRDTRFDMAVSLNHITEIQGVTRGPLQFWKLI
jgi:hypothetical protein